MPESATIEAPASVQTPASSPPKPAPSAPAKSAVPTAPKANRMDTARQALQTLSEKKPTTKAETKPESETTVPEKPKDTSAVEPKVEEEADPLEMDTPQESPAVPAEDKTVPKGKDGKPLGAWQLKEHYQKLARQYESEAVSLKAQLAKLGDSEALGKRLEEAESKAAKLDEEMRYVDYSRSGEFSEKYVKPYEEAWSRAVTELNELTVRETSTDPEGNPVDKERTATVQDLVMLSNMPLGQARKAAKAMFGDAAEDIMAHRRSIRELSDAQTKALEYAKSKGVEREKQTVEQQQKLHREIRDNWEKLNKEASEKQEFLKPKDGDDEWNDRLSKAILLTDESFKSNPRDAKLSPEQRLDVLKKHAAIRNRAIAYSPLKLALARVRSKVAELESKLAEFTESSPRTGNGKPPSEETTQHSGDPVEAAKSRLGKLATIS